MAMSKLLVDGKLICLDQDDCLLNLSDWTPEVAAALALKEGIVLTQAHWEIIQLVRQFYQQFELAPANRALVKYIAQELGPEKGNSLYLNPLFAGKPAKLAARLAGLPKPANCF